MRRLWIAAFLIAAASGCSVGPPVVTPDVAIASTWIEPKASWSEPAVIEWWKTLDDATLVAYVDAALAANTCYRPANGTVSSARATGSSSSASG